MPKKAIRDPTHAGSWYDESAASLGASIDKWMQAVEQLPNGSHAQAIIAPHAGYRYCGHVMAFAYKHIRPEQVKRIFLLGPSHHVYTRKCMLSPAAAYKTPFGEIPVDQDIYEELKATGAFEVADLDTDEAEHSLELHTPYIARAMQGHDFTLVPIIVGSISTDSEAKYGAILGKYLDDPLNAFVMSSDFCHWGSRFSYTFYDKDQGPIWSSIQWLDEEGMKSIETGEPHTFTTYLQKYKNTICGRHPIGVLLNMLKNCSGKYEIQFTKYDQSSKCMTEYDSSVSYAAATVIRTD